MVIKLIQIFLLSVGLAAASSSVKAKRPHPAPWDVDYLGPLCPAHIISAMDDKTWNTIDFIWKTYLGPSKNGDFHPLRPSYRASLGSVCNRCSPALINSPIFKAFLISYLLIDGFISKEAGEKLASKLQVNRFGPVMKMGFAINDMQPEAAVGSVLQKSPRILARDVEGAINYLKDKTSQEKFIDGILKIAKLLQDAHKNRVGHARDKLWMFPGFAREDFLALISSVKKGGDVVSSVEKILTERARKLDLEDSDQHTKLVNFSPKGFRIWYNAIKKAYPEKAMKHWKARCDKNWADYKLNGGGPFEEDVRLLDFDEFNVWSRSFTKSRMLSWPGDAKQRTKFVQSHPYAKYQINQQNPLN